MHTSAQEYTTDFSQNPETKLILDVQLLDDIALPSGCVPRWSPRENNLSDATFLVDRFGYRTALSRLNSNHQVDHTDRNLIEK